jgi:hypothetical protein
VTIMLKKNSDLHIARCLCQKVFSNVHNSDEPSFEQHFSIVQKEFVKRESLSADLNAFISWFMTLKVKGRTLYCSVPA